MLKTSQRGVQLQSEKQLKMKPQRLLNRAFRLKQLGALFPTWKQIKIIMLTVWRVQLPIAVLRVAIRRSPMENSGRLADLYLFK